MIEIRENNVLEAARIDSTEEDEDHESNNNNNKKSISSSGRVCCGKREQILQKDSNERDVESLRHVDVDVGETISVPHSPPPLSSRLKSLVQTLIAGKKGE